MKHGFLKSVSASLLALYSVSGVAEYAHNMPKPATVIGHQIYDLHILVNWVCLGIFFVVFGAMFYSIYRHRRSVGYKAAHFHENTTIEIIWTIIPFLILVGMAYPATSTILAFKDTSEPDLNIKVTGYQWKWEYEYLNDGFRFFSNLSTPAEQVHNLAPKGEHYLLEVDKPLVVPVGKKVRLVLTANDVIHAWWVPKFGVKQDAIPGMVTESWFKVDTPGTYRGQCAELCGKDHAYMPIVVEAVTQEKYAEWVAGEKAKTAAAGADANRTFSLDELKAQGEKVYAANCAACHQANGNGLPGTFPGLNGSQIVNGPKEAHLDIVFKGKQGTAMPGFASQLSDVELAAVVTYERNAWNNKTGDMVQPADVKALRK